MEEQDKAKEQIIKRKKKPLIRRILRALLYLIMSLVSLNILLYALLSIPAVQQRVVNFATAKLKASLNTEVSIQEARFSLFNQVRLKGIYIEDRNQDTLLYAQRLDVSLDLWRLIDSELSITAVRLHDFTIHINKQTEDSPYNFQFIVDAFASTDTTARDSTKSSLKIVLQDVQLKHGTLHYNILSAPRTPLVFNSSHIYLSDFNADVALHSIDMKALDVSINSLSAKEKAGFEIKNLQGQLFSNQSQLWANNVSLSLPHSHLNTSRLTYNLGDNKFEIETSDTEIDAHDLTAFLPSLQHLKHPILLQTKMTGIFPLIDIASISLHYGTDLTLKGKAFLSDCLHYDKSDIALAIDTFEVSPAGITSIAHLGDSTFVLPPTLRQLGSIYMKAKLDGNFSQFTLNGEAWTKQGGVQLRAKGSTNDLFDKFNLSAQVSTSNLHLAKLVGENTGLGKIGMDMHILARKTNERDLTATLQGKLHNIQYKGETIQKINVKGYYNPLKMGLTLDANLPQGRLWVQGEMSQAKIPDVHLQLQVDSLTIDRFYANDKWHNPLLYFQLEGDFKGINIDDLQGKIRIENLLLRDDKFSFAPSPITLEIKELDNKQKKILLNSSLLSANITGKYKFKTLTNEFNNLLYNYLPDVFPYISSKQEPENDFTFKLTAQNTESLNDLFPLPITILEQAIIEGNINTFLKQCNIKADLPQISYNKQTIRNTKIALATADSILDMLVNTQLVMPTGSYIMALKTSGRNNSLHNLLTLQSDSTGINMDGQIELVASFDRDEQEQLVSSLQVMPSTITIDKLKMNMLPSKIINKGVRTEVHNFAIGVNGKRYFEADGTISKLKTDSLTLYFDKAQVGDVLAAFDVNSIKASLNGNLLITSAINEPEIYAKNFQIEDITLFNDTLGTMNIESQWNEAAGAVKLNASLSNRDSNRGSIQGLIYTTRDSLDLKINLDRLPLAWTQPLFGDMLHEIAGSVSSGLTLKGRINTPQIKGWLGINDARLGIAYTNVSYRISDTIQISPDRIGFDKLKLHDMQGNTASISTTLTHTNFENIKYSANLTMDKLMILNTENRTDSLFFGKLFVSGTANIEGDDTGIRIQVKAKNEKNSSLTVLLPQVAEATDYKSVVYINTPKIDSSGINNNVQLAKIKKETIPLKLDLEIDLTPDMQIGILMNPITQDAIQARGAGKINFNYDMQTQDMKAFGSYTLSSGNVRINLKRISNIEFKIKEGSKLSFVGDPLKTKFDIKAYNRVKADLKSLDSSFEGDNNSTKVNVDCVLGINGSMNKMDLSYNIETPEASDDVQRKMKSIIATDEQKIKQFAYLLSSGTFYSAAGSGGNLGDGMLTSIASSTLSGGLDAIFGNVLGKQWEIGTNIESNDGTFTNMDMSVNVSTTLFDEKLRLNTNLGYRTDQSSTTQNSFIGDFDLEYQLNPAWKIKAYNQTNNQYYLQALTTQGIGIVYAKEAKTLKRLFSRSKKKKITK